MRGDPTDTMLLLAAHTALDALKAVYMHVDAIEKAGGLNSRGGQEEALCLADNLIANRKAFRELVAAPLERAIRERAS